MPSSRQRQSAPVTGNVEPSNPDSPDWGVTVNSNGAPPDEEFEETSQDRVAAMLQDLRGTEQARVRLYRISAQSKKLAWCAEYTPEEFEAGGLEMIRQQWGAGNYELRIYGATDSGSFGVVGRSQVEIVAPIVAPVVTSAGTSELAALLAKMNEQNAQILAAIAAPKPDPMANMKDMFTMMTMMREAMGLSGAAQQPQQKSSISEIVEAIKELKGASDLIAPRDEKPDFDPDNPMAVLPQLIELVKASISKPQPQVMPALALPSSIAEQPQTSQQLNQSEEEMQAAYIAEIRNLFDTLCKMSVDKKPVQEAAELVFDKLPDDLIDVMRSPEWFGALSMVAPNIDAHREYFTQVRDAALILFDEDAADEALGQST